MRTPHSRPLTSVLPVDRPYSYVNAEVSETDLHVATIAFGWVLGFVTYNFVTAWNQTHKFSVYVVLIWGEMAASFIFAVLAWLFVIGKISHSFAFFFILLSLWVIQVQFLLQIIINRVNLLWSDRKAQSRLKWGVALGISIINISVYCIWLPARLQISDRWIAINDIWDRVEKCIYLVVDAGLNLLFMRVVKQRLVDRGLDRYRPLVRTNMLLILVSMSMDVLIIGMMSLPNTLVYIMFHPVAYLVKLQIEMSLGALIVEISSAKPQRGTVANAFEGLKIAVDTHVSTTAYRIDDDDDLEGNSGGAPAVRTTRTPARPDLGVRLEKMRRDRKERKAMQDNGGGDVAIDMERRGSDFSLDVKEDRIEMDEWETPVHTLTREQTRGGDGNPGVRFGDNEKY
ncbi:hypothetical protein JCM8547_008231 [Rhodosporidiobolus lusitaniae]